MPEIHIEHNTRSVRRVPNFVLERIVENNDAAFRPRLRFPSNADCDSVWDDDAKVSSKARVYKTSVSRDYILGTKLIYSNLARRCSTACMLRCT